MGALTFEQEVTSSISPSRLFKSFALDSDNLIPKVAPQAFKSVELFEGNGGVGTKKCITFGEGSQFKSVIQHIDEIDEANHVFKYSVVGGDALGEALESISYVVKIESGSDGGSICKSTSIYHIKGEHHLMTEEKIKESKEKSKALFHAIEAYLHAHPDEYCN